MVADPIFVEPPGLFDLKENPIGRGQLFGGKIQQEPSVDIFHRILVSFQDDRVVYVAHWTVPVG